MMRRGYFDVVYTTDETRREVENRLRSRCEGGWTLRQRAGSARSGQRDFTIVFERESDMAKLCRSRSTLR